LRSATLPSLDHGDDRLTTTAGLDVMHAEASRVRKGSRLRLAAWVSGVAGLAAVIAAGAHLGDIEHFVRLLRALAPAWLLLACALQAGTYLAVAGSWRSGLLHCGVRPSVAMLLSLALQKLFVDQTLPSGGMSGTAFLVTALARRGIAPAAYLATLLADLVAHYGAYLLAAAVGVLLLWFEHALRPWMLGVALLFSLVVLVIPIAVLALRGMGHRAPAWVKRTPGIAALVEAFADAPLTVLRRPGVFAVMAALNCLVIALDALTLWTMLHALGQPVAFHVVLPSFVMALMVAMLGPIPLGLGTFEATCVAALVLQHVPIEAALTGTLLLRGWTTWLPMLPGLALVRHELRLPSRKQFRGVPDGRAPHG
jgi:hypothetical protein